MTVKRSTGLDNAMLDTSSFRALLNDGLLKVYAGTEPASADDAIGAATLLNTFTDNDTGAPNGLNFEASAVDRILSKDSTQVWSGSVVADDKAAFWRFVAQADDGTASTTAPRLQGNCAVAGGDLNFSSLDWTTGQLKTINSFNVPMVSCS